MTDLFWPGDERAGDHLTSAAFLRAMLGVERAWLDVLGRQVDLPDLTADDLESLAVSAEAAATPVVPLVRVLRERLDAAGRGDDARWVHRGLTSQDVVDSALMMLLRDLLADVRREVAAQVDTLVGLSESHRETRMVARTLTQHAVPSTFGLKAAAWLDSCLDVEEELDALEFPVQLGGAAGTMAAAVELGLDPDDATARLAAVLHLAPARPWHTSRAPVTRIGDTAVRATDAWGRIANDVLTLSRTEVGELSEGAVGGSSTMPYKQNPVLATLVRRAALTAPQLAATLHVVSAESVDERSAGPWQSEWATLSLLGRRALVAASQTSDLLAGLQVDPDRMRANLDASTDVLAEQRTMTDLTGHEPRADYLGAAGATVDAVLDRARRARKEDSP